LILKKSNSFLFSNSSSIFKKFILGIIFPLLSKEINGEKKNGIFFEH
jgi:hypothetical protein